MTRKVFIFNVVLVVLVACIAATHGWRHYLRMLPNAGRVPCANPARCPSNGICGGFGHEDCVNGEENDFGEEFEDRDALWTTSFCARDDDGDGKTNGDELGDPCCRWNRGTKPDRMTLISHPGERSSATTAPSCTRSGSPGAVAGLHIEEAGATRTALVWDKSTAHCVCSYALTVSGASGTTTYDVPHRFDQPDLSNSTHFRFIVPALTANTAYSYSMKAANRAGSSSAVSVSATTATADTPLDEAPLPEQDLSVQTAGTVGDLSAIPSEIYPYYAYLLVLIISVFVVGRVLGDPNSSVRYWAVHRTLRLPPASRAGKLLLTWTSELTWLGSVGLLALIGAMVAFYALAHDRLSQDVFSFDDGGLVWRTLGHIGGAVMALTLYPVTRYSIWSLLGGVSFERAIIYHRWLGIWTVLAVGAHGFGMWAVYANSSIGTSDFFSTINYPVLPGIGAGALLCVLGLFALEYFRRRRYGLFFITHMLAPAIVLLSVVHYPKLAFYLAIPGVLYLVDLARLIYSAVFRPTSVVSVKLYEKHSSSSIEDDIIELKLSKGSLKNVGAGQYVYLFVPRLSFMAHPFSICDTAPTSADDAGTVRICIKPMGSTSRSWTARLHHRVYKAKSIPRVFCVGPFGNPTVQFRKMEHIVLFAGGVGVTPMTTIAADVLRRGCCKRLRFVFAYRSVAVLQSVANELTAYASAVGIDVQVSVHCTDRGASSAVTGELAVEMEPMHGRVAVQAAGSHQESEENDAGSAINDKDVTNHIEHSRPDVASILAGEAQKANGNELGVIGVGVCGPAALMNEVLRRTRENVNGVRFLVHTETFDM